LIVSGIWWKRVELCRRAAGVAPLLLLLSGCGLDQLLFGPMQAPAPPPALPPARPSTAKTDVTSGLAPLPTPQQVLTAVPFGRSDPFAPLPVAAAPASGARAAGKAAPGAAAAPGVAAGGGPGAPAQAAPSGSGAAAAPARPSPPEVLLTGVIRSGGHVEALVSFSGRTGTLRRGDRGGRTTDLLPDGWQLASIRFGGASSADPPAITLTAPGRRHTVSLMESP